MWKTIATVVGILAGIAGMLALLITIVDYIQDQETSNRQDFAQSTQISILLRECLIIHHKGLYCD